MNDAYYIIPVLIFLPTILLILAQLVYYYLGVNHKYKDLQVASMPSLSILVPTKGEKIETVQGLLENIDNAEWDKSKIEVIIISDDTEEYFKEMQQRVKIPENLKVIFYRRGINKRGYKSGALHDGFKKSTGELILTMDVDARIYTDSIKKGYAQIMAENADAVTMNWIGYGNVESTTVNSLIISTYYTNTSIITGRDHAGMPVMPVGCGTLFKRDALNAVDSWDPEMIQDDLEIGTRLIHAGKKIKSSDANIKIEVPDTFNAFYTQQTRWAMGSMEVLSRRFRYIISSKIGIIKRLDIIAFLLQYIPLVLTFLMAIALVIISPFIHFDILFNPLFFLWIILLGLYAYVFVKIGDKFNINAKKAVSAMGRLSSYTVAISPFVLLWIFRAFKSRRIYRITPKGAGHKMPSNIYAILAFGIFFIAGSLFYLIHFYLLTGLWLLYYSMGYISTFYLVYKDTWQKNKE